MKKIAFVAVMAIAVAAFTGCGNKSSKADNSTAKDEDSVAYALGLTESQQFLQSMQQLGIDSAYVDEFLKGMKEGLAGVGDKKKDAYSKGVAVGVSEAMRFKQMINPQLFPGDSTKTLSMDRFMEGFTAGVKHKKAKMTLEQAQRSLMTGTQRITARYAEKAYGHNKQAGEAYIAKMSRQPGVKSLGNGIFYKEVKVGSGKIPTAQDMVKVNYNGMTIDGKSFDKRDGATMPVGQGMIKGWEIALSHMKEGSTWEVYIPYDAAYGPSGLPNGAIKPYSALHFTITLVSIEKQPQQGQPGQPAGVRMK